MDRQKGRWVWRWEKREIIYISLLCYHQDDSCVKVGSDESHFNVSLIVRDKVTKQCPQTTTFEEKEEPKRTRTEVPLLTSLKPVLNWANVCSPNILGTVRRTMIRFLIKLLVRRTWFRQFDELYFVFNWLVMRCKLRPELAADSMIENEGQNQVRSSQYTLIIPYRVIQLTTISFWVPETRLRLPQVNIE